MTFVIIRVKKISISFKLKVNKKYSYSKWILLDNDKTLFIKKSNHLLI